MVERGDRRGLGQAVALEHHAAERLLELAQHLDRQGRAAGDAHAQGRDVVVGAVRDVKQRAVHRRDTREDRDPFAASILSAFAASKRGSSVRQAPAMIAALSVQVCPNEWNSGSPPKMTSSGPS